jgi:Holliday junction resolvase RusA-like endonuclease
MVVLQHYFSAPSRFKSEGSRLEQDGLPYAKRPDFDNLAKLINDALNGVAWLDDSQICSFYSCKLVTKERDGFSLMHITELPKTKMNFDEIVDILDQNLIYPKDYHGVAY